MICSKEHKQICPNCQGRGYIYDVYRGTVPCRMCQCYGQIIVTTKEKKEEKKEEEKQIGPSVTVSNNVVNNDRD